MSVDWTLARALRTARFWWIALGFVCALFAWYAVQVHQTKYLIEVGFSPIVAAWALGIVSVVGIPGQIGLGALSDRIGRGMDLDGGLRGLCHLLRLPDRAGGRAVAGAAWLMVIAQGSLGYALTSVMGLIVAEIFEGPHYGSIFGMLTVALIGGGAAGPWLHWVSSMT